MWTQIGTNKKGASGAMSPSQVRAMIELAILLSRSRRPFLVGCAEYATWSWNDKQTKDRWESIQEMRYMIMGRIGIRATDARHVYQHPEYTDTNQDSIHHNDCGTVRRMTAPLLNAVEDYMDALDRPTDGANKWAHHGTGMTKAIADTQNGDPRIPPKKSSPKRAKSMRHCMPSKNSTMTCLSS